MKTTTRPRALARTWLVPWLLWVLFAPGLRAERLALLPGHLHPKALAGVEQGRLDAASELPYLMLVLKPSPSQQADLDRFLAGLQDPGSSDFHRWLSPEQYAARFGASQRDVDAMVAWLQSQGLTVLHVGRGRNAIAFRGTVRQIEHAFATEMHRYVVRGEAHYANAADPSVPERFTEKVAAIHGLHDFRPRPAGTVRPLYNFVGRHYIAPGDLAVIYDITPLAQAGFDGTGQKLAVGGATNVHLSDIELYRKTFNLPANDPHLMLVPDTTDPGFSDGDLPEADLDLEVSGGVAPRADIFFVYSSNVFDAVQYIIDQNLAPVLSLSYGACELIIPPADAQTLQIWARQANAQGITWVNAAGDNGAADCFGEGDASMDTVLAVDLPAGIPEVTGVGGTEFIEGTGSYWSTSNDANNTSALSYIPEEVWKDGFDGGSLGAAGGGVSTMFPKPAWQAGAGVPADGARDVPDVALPASAKHDGYAVYTSGHLLDVGGTSAGAPALAGIFTLLNQYLVAKGAQAKPGLGNANPKLYALAHTAGVFHDITVGDNKVNPCLLDGSCPSASIGYKAGPGYDLASGLGSIDVNHLVTSWQSAVLAQSTVSMTVSSNAASITFEDSAVLTATVTSSNSGMPTGMVNFSMGGTSAGSAALVAGAGGSATATFNFPGILLSSGANTIEAEYGGDNSYLGTAASVSVNAPAAGSVSPKIGMLADAASFKQHFAPGGIVSVFGTDLSPGTGGAPLVPLPIAMAGVSGDVNGLPVALFYVSPTQLNVQIPFETAPGGTSVLTVDNNGKTATFMFKVDAAAPAIFAVGGTQGAVTNALTGLIAAPAGSIAGVTTAPVKASDYVAIYCTGVGAVNNGPGTGEPGPATLPLAEVIAAVKVSIGGQMADPVFAGLAPGLVGLYQVNVQVPAKASTGDAVSLSLTAGGAASNVVSIAVQ